MELFNLTPVMLNMFDGNTNVTTQAGLSEDVKIYWSDRLIDLVEPKLYHSQFGQKVPIPQHGGKTIEFRKWGSLPKQLTPLVEGVTPDGQSMSMSTIRATIAQYGGYVQTSDILNLVAIDNTMEQAVKQISRQAYRTIDTIDREELVTGTNVVYAGGRAARYLVGSTDKLTVDTIKKAVRELKNMNAEPYDGDYVAIIHPDCTYDLTNDNDWKAPHQYVDTENIYSGEIGRIAGVRFVESTEAKKFVARDLIIADAAATISAGQAGMTVASWDAATLTITIDEALSQKQADALPGRAIIIGGQAGVGSYANIVFAEAGAAGSAKIVLRHAPAATPTDNDAIIAGEAGASGVDIYATLIFGANAYGITEVSGGGLEFIAKQLGSGGTADPLNQRATCGWKCTRVCKILVDEYMVRIESASSFNDHVPN